MTHPDVWIDLIDRWDRQQAVYIPQRESMYATMLDTLTALCPADDPVVLDLACGPGAISRRLLQRLPSARTVAVDVDPVLLEIGRRAHGDFDGRMTWVRADLREPDWPAALDSAGAPATYDAVLSSTALHWLDPATLTATYRRAHELLRPGGILVNADYLPLAPGSRLREVSQAIAEQRQQAAVDSGSESWEAWWAAVAQEPALSDVLADRDRLWPEGSRSWTGASYRFHESALLDAGFTEAGTVWQDLNERILVALA